MKQALTRREKETLLSLMLRGHIETFRGETEAEIASRLIRKRMVLPNRGSYTMRFIGDKCIPVYSHDRRTKYELTNAGFAAAKQFMGREGQKPIWQLEFNSREKHRNPKYRKSKIAGRFDRYGYLQRDGGRDDFGP